MCKGPAVRRCVVHLKNYRSGWSMERKMPGVRGGQRGQIKALRVVEGDPVKCPRASGWGLGE